MGELHLVNMNASMLSIFLFCFVCINVSFVVSNPAKNEYIPAYPQPLAPQYHQGLQYGALGCCRSSFPDEYGSWRQRSDCVLRTQPYCSGYGFCTQSQDYGTEGCQENCPKPNYAKYWK